MWLHFAPNRRLSCLNVQWWCCNSQGVDKSRDSVQTCKSTSHERYTDSIHWTTLSVYGLNLELTNVILVS